MLELEVNRWGYLEASAEDWLNDIGQENDDLTQSYRQFATLEYGNLGSEGYASGETVAAWLRDKYGDAVEISGIYGEPGYVETATCNYDTMIDDISYVFLHFDFRDDDADVWEAGTLLVLTGRGYFGLRHEDVRVFDFVGDDDGDAFSNSRGWVSHASSRDGCGVDWIIDTPGALWPNGGVGADTEDVSDWIVTDDMTGDPDDDFEPWLQCPECGDRLVAYLG